jgi:glycosyltransferase involved in cell wall biosynthesis
VEKSGEAVSRYSILINNFNYGRYLGKALESCLAQDRSLLREVIVVDDGSSDESPAVLARFSAENPTLIRVINQENSGQLAAMNRGVRAATGDVICFLDADDFLLPDYLRSVDEVWRKRTGMDFLFVDRFRFSELTGMESNRDPFDEPFREPLGIGLTSFLVAGRKYWIGNSTSTLSLRRSLAKRISEVSESLCEEWFTRADDVFVFGGSILGGNKYFLPRTLVGYRVHERNHFCGVSLSSAEESLYLSRRRKLIRQLTRESGIDAKDLKRLWLLFTEAMTIKPVTTKLARFYLGSLLRFSRKYLFFTWAFGVVAGVRFLLLVRFHRKYLDSMEACFR